MKRIILATLLACVSVSVAQAACDTKSLKGSYAVALSGNDCGYIGVANFDGRGTMTISTSIFGCGAAPIFGSGTFSYNLNANCVGTATGTGSDYYFVFNKILTTGSIMISGGHFLQIGTITKQ